MTTVKKTTEETVKPVSKSSKIASKKEGALSIYIGPTIRKTGLQNGAILTAGLPKDAQVHVEACPAIGNLLIAIEYVAEARLNIAKKGTPENKFYEKVADYAKGVK